MGCGDCNGIELGSLSLAGQVQVIIHTGDNIHAGDGQSDACADTHNGDGSGTAGAGTFRCSENVFYAGSSNLQVTTGKRNLCSTCFQVGLGLGGEDMNGDGTGHAEIPLRVACLGGGAGDQLTAVAAGGCVYNQAAGLYVGILNVGTVGMVGNCHIHANASGEGLVAGCGEAHLVADKVSRNLDGAYIIAIGICQFVGIISIGILGDNLNQFRAAGSDVNLQRVFLQHIAGVGSDHKAEGLPQIHFPSGGDDTVEIGFHRYCVGTGECFALNSGYLNVATVADGNLKGVCAVIILGNRNGLGTGLYCDRQLLFASQCVLRHAQDNGFTGNGLGIGCRQIVVSLHRNILFLESNREGNFCSGHDKGELVIANGSSSNGGICKSYHCLLPIHGFGGNGHGIAGIGFFRDCQSFFLIACICNRTCDAIPVSHKPGFHGNEHILGNRKCRLIGVVCSGSHRDGMALAVCVQIAHFQTVGFEKVADPGGHFEGQRILLSENDISSRTLQFYFTVDHVGDDKLHFVAFRSQVLGGGADSLIGVQAIGRIYGRNIGVHGLGLLDRACIGQCGGLGQCSGINGHRAQGCDGAGGVGVGLVVVVNNCHCDGTDQPSAYGTGTAAGTAAGGCARGKFSFKSHVALRHREDVIALTVCLNLGSHFTAFQSGNQVQIFQGMIYAGGNTDKNFLSGVCGFGIGGDITAACSDIGCFTDVVSGSVFGCHKAAAVGGCRIQLIGQRTVADGAGAFLESGFPCVELPEAGHDGGIGFGHLEGNIGGCQIAGENVNCFDFLGIGIGICDSQDLNRITGIGIDFN